MGKTIEVRLSDAQYRVLSEAARRSGVTQFYSFCRDILMAGLELHEPIPPTAADDRIARIEDAIARLSEVVLRGQPVFEPELDEGRAQSAEPPVDVDSIVEAQFHEAEQAGLTEHVPDENEEVMRYAGVRPLSRRPIPFSANSGPKHLAGL